MGESGSSVLPRSAAGGHSPWLIAVIVSIATFMEVLDTTIANVALNHIAGSVGASQDEATYILTSYLVSNAIVLTISGWLANVIGRKRYYMISVALFTASSLMCATSTSLGMIIFFRVLQGIGGGGLAPVEQSIFADSFPAAKRAIAFSIYGFTIVTAPAIGPALGGWLTDNYSWHWVFLINLPIGLLSLVLTSIFISDSAQVKADRKKLLANGIKVDWIGFILVAVGFGCLQVVLDRFERDDGFSSDFILAMTAISAAALSVLIAWELYTPQPVVNLRLLKSPAFAVSSFMLFVFGFIIQSTTQLIPQLAQALLSYDATNAGLTLAVGGLATVCIMPLVGFITGRIVQPRYLVGLAFAGIALALYFTADIDLTVSFARASFARATQVMWLPFVFVPISAVQYVGVPPESTNQASAITNLMRNLGGSFGVSVVTTELLRNTQRHQVYLGAHVTAYNGFPLGHSLTSIAASVQAQASILSYLDAFRFLALISLCVVPFAFLLPNVEKGKAGAE